MIELIMVIVLTGILATITAVFIVEPMRAWADQSRRTALVDDAEIALRRMAREIRGAVPNSVRTPNALTLEFHDAVAGGRYRASPPGELLQFDNAAGDQSFDVFGIDDGSYPDHQAVVFNLGTDGSDLWNDAGVITPAGTITVASGNLLLPAPFQFGRESPEQRIYLSRGAVRYTCNLGDGTLLRDGAVVTTGVTGCSFAYSAGSATRTALATLSLSLARDGESMTLLRQVHVENLP